MSHHGAIMDISPNGYLDCFTNLCYVLYGLYSRRMLPKKRRRIKVMVSTIVGTVQNPRRVEYEKIYSFGYLCRVYYETEGRDFDSESYKNKERDNLEDLQQQGKKTMAWAVYNQYRHTQKLIKQNNIVQSLPKDQREAKQKEFEELNGIPMLRIG